MYLFIHRYVYIYIYTYECMRNNPHDESSFRHVPCLKGRLRSGRYMISSKIFVWRTRSATVAALAPGRCTGGDLFGTVGPPPLGFHDSTGNQLHGLDDFLIKPQFGDFPAMELIPSIENHHLPYIPRKSLR